MDDACQQRGSNSQSSQAQATNRIPALKTERRIAWMRRRSMLHQSRIPAIEYCRDSEHGNQDRTGIPTDVLRAHRTADKSRYPGVQGLGEHNPIAGPYRATRTMLDIAIVDIVLSERRPRKHGKSRRSRGSPRSSSWCRPPARSLKDLPQRNTEIPFHHLYAIASQRPQIQSSSEIYDAYHHFRFVRGRQFRSLNQSVFEVLTPPTVRWVQASVPR